ncbi:MAG: hypothetical protein ACO3FO_06745 [Candidatus Nanopelagicaceae bacterium]
MSDAQLRELMLELEDMRIGLAIGSEQFRFITAEICVVHDEWFRREQDSISNLVMN